MKKLRLLWACAMLCAAPAFAQDGVTGFGTLALTNSSTPASTMTVGPNSGVWPSTPQMVYVLNDASSAGSIFVCPVAPVNVTPTCTVAAGLELTPGRSWAFLRPSPNMTLIAASTATIQFQW